MILLAAGVVVLSVLGMLVSMLQPQDSGGRGRDSHGTRVEGFRALYELLSELGVPVERELAPPQADKLGHQTLLLIGPIEPLLQTGPKYVEQLLTWVEQGGRLVAAPRPHMMDDDSRNRGDDPISMPRDLLEILELDDWLTHQPVEDEWEDSWDENAGESPFERAWNKSKEAAPPPEVVEVHCEGLLARLANDVKNIALPAAGAATLIADDPPDGAITFRDDNGSEQLLAAVVKRGKGDVIVLSDPRLLNNHLLARADNSVLAAHLLAPRGEPVVFDEFYHGLSVRGNVLYLLTLPGVAAVTVALLAAIGVWAWRSAVFLGPPLADPEHSRRDVREYIDAMADFFARASDAPSFLASEVRDGVLRNVSQELKLPAETPDVETIVAALRRQNPQRASKLASAISDLDAQLASGGPSRAQFVPVVQRLVSCM
jgi:hypothetical protein